MTPIESNIFGKLLTLNMFSVILGQSPDSPTLTCLDAYRGAGGAMGGRNKGSDLMFLSSKCDMSLESP